MKVTKVLSFVIALAFLAMASILQSCNDTPADIGLVTDTLNLKKVSTSDLELIVNNGSTRFPLNSRVGVTGTLLGLSGDYKAFTTVRYDESTIPDSLENLTIGDILSAKLYVYQSSYGFGDLELRNIDFEVKSIDHTISIGTEYSDLFSEDGTPLVTTGNVLAEANYQATDFADTIFPAVKLDFSKETIIDWLKFRSVQRQYLDSLIGLSSALGDTLNEAQRNQVASHYNFDRELATYKLQVGFLPRGNSDVIFGVFNQQVSLDENDVPESSDGEFNNKAPFIEVETSSSTFYILPARASSFVNNFEPDTEEFAAQGVIAQRGIMELDLSTIPTNATIHNATFELFIKRDESLIGSLGLVEFISASVREEADENTIIRGSALGLMTLDENEEPEDKILFSNFADVIKGLLISRSSENSTKFVTFRIAPNTEVSNEALQLDKLSFHGIDDPDPEKQPILKIIYSTWEE